MKVLGLATGALVASIAVWAFNDWRTVTGDDLLAATLTEQCIPYVTTGATPFEGMGRAVGVYDNVELDDRVSGGGAAIVLDDRFTATWGEIADLSLRVCRLDGRATAGGYLAIDLDGFVERITPLLAPLGDMRPDAERLGRDGDAAYQTLGWLEAGKAEGKGNRVVLTVINSQVSNVIVVQDLSD